MRITRSGIYSRVRLIFDTAFLACDRLIWCVEFFNLSMELSSGPELMPIASACLRDVFGLLRQESLLAIFVRVFSLGSSPR